MKYPLWLRRWYGEGLVCPKGVPSTFAMGSIVWIGLAVMMCTFLEGWAVSITLAIIEIISLILTALFIIPLMLRSTLVYYFGCMFFFFNLSLLFFFKVGNVALAHVHGDPTSDTLNLSYPYNWIVFLVCLFPLLGVYISLRYMALDFRAWYEKARLPFYLDLKKKYYRISGAEDKATQKITARIDKKYDKVERHYRENKWYQKLLRWYGHGILWIFIFMSLGAELYPFILSGEIRNAVMLFGYTSLGTILFAGVVYSGRRMHFQYLFEKELGLKLIPVDKIPDYKPEMNKGIQISKELVVFPSKKKQCKCFRFKK